MAGDAQQVHQKGKSVSMNPKSNNEPRSAQERATNIERMANAIIEDTRKRDAERHRRNELEMDKLKRQLEGGKP